MNYHYSILKSSILINSVLDNATNQTTANSFKQPKKSHLYFFFCFLFGILAFLFTFNHTALANTFENETIAAPINYMFYHASIPLTIILAITLLCTYSSKEQWRQWLSFALILGIFQSILAFIPLMFESQLLNFSFNIILSGFILILWPHIGRHILRTNTTDPFIDKIFIGLSVINAIYTLTPLFPESNFIFAYPLIWPSVLLLVIPALYPAIKAKKQGSIIYAVATLAFVMGACLPFIITPEQSIYPQIPWGLFSFALASCILTLCIKPEHNAVLSKVPFITATSPTFEKFKDASDFAQDETPLSPFRNKDAFPADLQQLFKANSAKVDSETATNTPAKKTDPITTRREVPFPFNAFEDPLTPPKRKPPVEPANSHADAPAFQPEDLLNFTPQQQEPRKETHFALPQEESFFTEVSSQVIEQPLQNQSVEQEVTESLHTPSFLEEPVISSTASSSTKELIQKNHQPLDFNTLEELPNIAALKELNKSFKDSANIQLALSSDFPIQIFEPLDFSDDPDLAEALKPVPAEAPKGNLALDSAIESIVEALAQPADADYTSAHPQKEPAKSLSLHNSAQQPTPEPAKPADFQATPEFTPERTLSEIDDPSELLSFMNSVEHSSTENNHTEYNTIPADNTAHIVKEQAIVAPLEETIHPTPFEASNASGILPLAEKTSQPSSNISSANNIPALNNIPATNNDEQIPSFLQDVIPVEPLIPESITSSTTNVNEFIPTDIQDAQNKETHTPSLSPLILEPTPTVTPPENALFNQATAIHLSNAFTSLLAQARIASLHNDFSSVVRLTESLAQAATQYGLAPLERMASCVMRAAEAKDASAIQDLLPELVQKTENTIIDIQKKALNSSTS